MDAVSQAFLDRLTAAASQRRDLRGISQWIIANTRDPRNSAKPWSFKDHEFQIGILDDEATRVIVRKCSQVGVSEMTVRLLLAMLAIFTSSTAIYTLPTTSFARKFSKSRIDTVIKASSELKALMPSGSDSSELKQLGNSFLYVSGSFGQGAAISIPADILINDEVDFSNQKALTTFSSRLGHAEGGGIRREFSTPTVEGYGVSKSYSISSQARYMVKHDRCGQWVAPDWFDDVVIPGFDDAIMEFEALDYQVSKYKVEQAHLLCPHCRHEITQANLCDASKRQWVHTYPDRVVHGYQVMPYDVPVYNPIPKTLSYIEEYERKADWVNFKVGLPFEDAESSFLKERIDQATRLITLLPVPGAAYGAVMGVDIGKTSWVTLGLPIDGKLHVVYKERIRQGGDNELTDRLQTLMDYFGVVKCVIDAAPDFSTALTMIEKNYEGRVFGCYYVRSTGTKMTNVIVDEAELVLKVDRTGTFDTLAKFVNGGAILFSKDVEQETVSKHLQAVKRVSQTNNQGELIHSWVSTDDDHYAHSLNYLVMAYGMVGYTSKKSAQPSLPLAGKVRVRTGDEEENRTSLLPQRRRTWT